jgi:fused signal recognition particle receptor
VSGLAKTRGNLTRRLLEAWRGPAEVNEWLLEAEEALLSSDVGAQATRTILDGLRAKLGNVSDRDSLLAALKEEVRGLLVADGLPTAEDKPRVLLVVGVNGVGKTTTIGKLAYRYRQDGKKVLLIAADTFRAAAIEQLAMWAERVGADLVKHQHGADPSAVAFDGVKAAVARGADVAILDTAGRLHVKANLMEELKKISRTVARHVEGAPHEVLLVIDATTGQNALNQARLFNEAIPLTGVVLAKLDGTAKGGIALAICRELNLPIRYVGLGERPNDLAEFDPEAFVNALFADLENPS